MTSPDTVLLAHGSGGLMMHELIASFFESYDSEELRSGDDAAVLSATNQQLAFSTDTYVVTPHIFPGGDIGRLAICGTVNDVATSGAIPQWISVGFVLEEGFSLTDLRRICQSMNQAAKEAQVTIVTGDTKVVGRGQGDGIYINTSGIGIFKDNRPALSGARCQPKDKILLSGTLGDHGIAIISQREGLSFSTTIQSDAAPLNHLVQAVLEAAPHTRCFRDPTRGGLASTVNELARQSNTVFEIDEESVPVRDEVRGACDMLGYDVFQVANEGKMVAVVPPDEANAALAAMRASRYGEHAACIGEVKEYTNADKNPALSHPQAGVQHEQLPTYETSQREQSPTYETSQHAQSPQQADVQHEQLPTYETSQHEQSPRYVEGFYPQAFVCTAYGSRRILDMLAGELLPRIC